MAAVVGVVVGGGGWGVGGDALLDQCPCLTCAREAAFIYKQTSDRSPIGVLDPGCFIGP